MDDDIDDTTAEQIRDYWMGRRITDEDDLIITPPDVSRETSPGQASGQDRR